MATLLKVLNNLADIKSTGGVALGLGTQGDFYVGIGASHSKRATLKRIPRKPTR
jgi:hypothetical protein